MASRPKPAKRNGASRRLREVDRILIACFMLGWVFVFAFVMGGGWSKPTLREMVNEQPAAVPADHGLATAAVVFMPVSGDTCRQNVIDNATWRVISRTEVSCNDAIAASRRDSGAATQENARLNAIREGFARK